MKIAVINFSGNVGKSTVARHLLSPRMNNATVIPVETINSDGGADEAIKGKQYGQLVSTLDLLDDAVVDVGASNVEDFINLMKQYDGSHEDYDFFVVPTVPETKQLRDTISTIDALHEIGVPGKNIRLLFNKVEPDDLPEYVFSSLYDYHNKHSKRFTLKNEAVIHTNDIYGKINYASQTISEIMADQRDFKDLIKKAQTTEEKVKFSQLLAIKRLAQGVTKELNNVFKTLLN